MCRIPALWRNVGVALGGTAAAQLIPVLGSLVLARLYAPEQFGAYSVWLGAVLVLGIMLTGRLETALAIEPDGDPRREAATRVLATVLIACIPIALIVVALAKLDATRWGGVTPSLSFALVPTAAAVAITQTWQSWAAADGSYRLLGLMRIAQALVITALQILSGLWIASAEALAWAYFTGTLLAAAISFWALPPGRLPRWHDLRAFWSRHRRFPTYSLPADTVNSTAAQLPLLIVAVRFGAEAAGLLAMTLRTLGAPIGLLGRAVLDVFKRYAAEAWRDRGECRTEYLNTLKTLTMGSALACFSFLLAGEQLFVLAFGETWRGAGTMAIWLLPLFALRFVASPLSYMVYIAGKQHIDLLWQVALLTSTVVTLYAGSSLVATLIGYSAAYSLLYVVYLFMSYRFACGSRMPA